MVHALQDPCSLNVFQEGPVHRKVAQTRPQMNYPPFPGVSHKLCPTPPSTTATHPSSAHTALLPALMSSGMELETELGRGPDWLPFNGTF
mmetsp:Transcript_5312/g.8367  ORF Transcript_5312/g.8367 Transcript_5312/m.8367 type:complete len:90 (-) Transcript_5312:396-665(-)